MKKITALLLCVSFLFLFTGCGSEVNSGKTSKKNSAVDQIVKNQQERISGNSEENTSSNEEAFVPNDTDGSDKSVDVDLTKLSSTMVYSEVYNMMNKPETFIDKTIKMKGQFSFFKDKNTGNQYYSCVIADATACCQQGLEFVLEGDYKYPDDYPSEGEEITVVGKFKTYMEGTVKYCHLVEAAFVA